MDFTINEITVGLSYLINSIERLIYPEKVGKISIEFGFILTGNNFNVYNPLIHPSFLS